MLDTIFDWNRRLWLGVEETFVPLPQNSDQYRICHLAPSLYLVPAAIITEIAVCVVNVVSYATSFFFTDPPVDPQRDFSAVCKNPRLWENLGPLKKQITLGQDDPNFLIGSATCTAQDSAPVCPNSQWKGWETQVVRVGNRACENGPNLFALYSTEAGRREITNRLHKLGVNSFRISIDWSQIEPQQGQFNQVALEVYLNFCAHLRNEGITPMVTLHHFAEPTWFHNMGSFEREENIQYFRAFVNYVCTNLTQDYKNKPLVDLFCTINEPGIEAFSRYIRGAFSPGVHFDFHRAGLFLKGALKAHTAAYDAIKTLRNGAQVKVGFTHQKLCFTATNPLTYPAARYLTRLIDDTVINYFGTGIFDLKIPFTCNISETNGVRPHTDFIGIQYYTRMSLDFKDLLFGTKPMTQMPFPEDPEGIYEAIVDLHRRLPDIDIIITEFGISTHDDKQRKRHMERVLYAIQRAREVVGKRVEQAGRITKGEVMGIFLWCFCDNGEWDMGLEPQAFGAYATRTDLLGRVYLSEEPKAGVEPFIAMAQAWQAAHAHEEAAI